MKSVVCPFCEARFLYPDLKKRSRSRTGVCPHCGKTYRVSRKYTAVFLIFGVAVLMAMDWGLLSLSGMNLIFLMAATILGVTAVYLLLPFTVRFRKAEPDSGPKKRARKKAVG